MWLESHNGRGNVPTGSFHSQPMLWKALSLEEEESNGEKWGQSSKMWHPPFIQGWGCPGHGLDYSVVYWGLMPRSSRHSLITWLRWLQVPPANSWVSSAFLGNFPLGRKRPELLHRHPGSLLCALPLWNGKQDLTYRPSPTMGSFWSSKDQAWDPLDQWSPTFLVPGTGFVEENFSKDRGREVVVSGWFIYCAVSFYYYYISTTSDHQALDPGGWGPLLWTIRCCHLAKPPSDQHWAKERELISATQVIRRAYLFVWAIFPILHMISPWVINIPHAPCFRFILNFRG